MACAHAWTHDGFHLRSRMQANALHGFTDAIIQPWHPAAIVVGSVSTRLPVSKRDKEPERERKREIQKVCVCAHTHTHSHRDRGRHLHARQIIPRFGKGIHSSPDHPSRDALPLPAAQRKSFRTLARISVTVPVPSEAKLWRTWR